jgi:hypothetical protein
MTNCSDTSVDKDIIEKVASDTDILQTELLTALTKEGGPEYEMVESTKKCYTLQSIRNRIEPQIKQAASDDTYKLVDPDGYIFWVDQYDGLGAYIHTDDGDTHYISLSQLKDFSLTET